MKSLGALTMALPAPAWAIGSYDKDGKPNVMTAAWGGICCSDPACLTVSLRPATYSYTNIMERQAYTVSIASETHAAAVDYFGLVSGKDTDKFAKTGLTPVKSDLVDAPYIAEFPLVVECKVIHTYKIGLHTQFIGEIMDVKADEAVLDDKGKVDPAKLKPVMFGPVSRTYYGIGAKLGKAFNLGKSIE